MPGRGGVHGGRLPLLGEKLHDLLLPHAGVAQPVLRGLQLIVVVPATGLQCQPGHSALHWPGCRALRSDMAIMGEVAGTCPEKTCSEPWTKRNAPCYDDSDHLLLVRTQNWEDNMPRKERQVVVSCSANSQ